MGFLVLYILIVGIEVDLASNKVFRYFTTSNFLALLRRDLHAEGGVYHVPDGLMKLMVRRMENQPINNTYASSLKAPSYPPPSTYPWYRAKVLFTEF